MDSLLALLALPANWMELSDEELGDSILPAWLAFQAEKAGMPHEARTQTWARQLIAATAAIDSDSVPHAPLESMIRKACRGDFAKAGKMLREIMLARAERIVADKYAPAGIKQAVGRKRAGRKTAAKSKAVAASEHAKWADLARTLIADGTAPHNVASIVARRVGASPRTIRNALQRSGVLIKKRK